MMMHVGRRYNVNAYENFNDLKLSRELATLKAKIEGTGETVFMRMLHELQVYQMELELQNRELREAQHELEETRDRYADVYDFAPLAYFTFDSHGSIQELNLAGANLLGKDRLSLPGTPFVNFVARHQRNDFLTFVRACITGEAGKTGVEFDLELPDGKAVKVETARVGKQILSGNINACRMALIEVTEHRMAELKLRLTSKVLENTQEGIMLTDAQQRIIAVNPAFLKTTGYDSDEIIGYTPSKLKSGYHDEEFYREMHASFRENDGWQGMIWNRRKNGEIYKESLNIKVIRKNNGEVDCYIGIFSDILSEAAMKNKLQELDYYDKLTGLVNRSLLYDRLQQALVQSRRGGSLMAVLFLDLDNFRDIHLRHGQGVANQVLREVAGRLTYCLREGDTLSRLEGDEFVAVLRDIGDAEAAAQIAERMVQVMEKPLVIDEIELPVTLSAGISVSPQDGEEVTVLLKNADTALYYAKGQGRSNYQYFTAAMNNQAL
jgi:diguanylate cyclase (GGDEF)-like protein/PAS domain S-box-containing protein